MVQRVPLVRRVRRVPLANGTRGGRNVQYASAGERAASARILLSVFVSDKQPDTGIQERAVGTRSEVELDVLVAAEFAMENAVELDARLVLVLDNQKELSVVLDGSWSQKQAEEDDVVGFYT